MRVLVFGDSIAQGFWDSEGGWVGRLRKHYDLQKINGQDDDPPTIFNLGVSGDSSADVLARLESEAKARTQDELSFVIAVGINDARTNAGKNFSDSERYEQNLYGILQTARTFSTKIMFVGLTPCDEARSNPVAWGNSGYTNDRIKQFDDTLKHFCQQNLMPFVAVFGSFLKAMTTAELLPDSLHPNDQGHQLILDLVQPELAKLLKADS